MRGLTSESRAVQGPEVRPLPGYGLGLAPTRRLVEAYGGTLQLTTEKGAGTHAVVKLPLAAASAEGEDFGSAANGAA